MEAILDPRDTSVLREAMRIGAGRMDEEPATNRTTYNLTLVQTLAGLPQDALERYAETGQLPASSWAPDAAMQAHQPGEPAAGEPDDPQLVLPGFPAPHPIKSPPADA